MKAYRLTVMIAVSLTVMGCASMVASAGSGLAGNLSIAIMNQDDPELVRDGAPAYLLMLDSFVQGSPDNEAVLRAAAELYSAYGVVFVDDQPGNVAAAGALGMRTIHAERFDAIAGQLREHVEAWLGDDR